MWALRALRGRNIDVMADDDVTFLTREWAEALDEAARASQELRDATSGVTLTIQQEVDDDEGGQVRYALVLDDGAAEVVWGGVERPDVTFVQSRDAAEQLSRGELNAQGAFVLGKLRVRGDVEKLVSARDAFATFEGDVFARVRERTTY